MTRWVAGGGTSSGGSGGGISANAPGTANNPITSASATRPTGLTRVYWYTPTQPVNWANGDVWEISS